VHVNHLESMLLALRARGGFGVNVVVVDLAQKLHPAVDRSRLPSAMCKPLAILTAPAEELLWLDFDVHLFANPEGLFGTATFMASGMLLFREAVAVQRLTETVPKRYAGAVDLGATLRAWVNLRMSPQFLGGALEAACGEDAGPSGRAVPCAAEWRPSQHLLAAPLMRGLSHRHIDAAVIVWNKRRRADIVRVFASLYRHHGLEIKARGLSEDAVWLACEFAGADCGVSPWLPPTTTSASTSGRGPASDCIQGVPLGSAGRLQFHPELAVPSHCKCPAMDWRRENLVNVRPTHAGAFDGWRAAIPQLREGPRPAVSPATSTRQGLAAVGGAPTAVPAAVPPSCVAEGPPSVLRLVERPPSRPAIKWGHRVSPSVRAECWSTVSSFCEAPRRHARPARRFNRTKDT